MKLGIVGAGHMGAVHGRCFARMEGVDWCVFDRNSQTAQEFSEKFGVAALGSLEELISTCDAVDICLPTDAHIGTASAALKAKKPVFLEKPMVRSLEEGRELLELEAEAGVCCMPGMVGRFFPEYAKAHAMVGSGAVGTPAAIRMRRGGGMPQGVDGWFGDHARSGGVLLDLAIHEFDWLLWTFGPIASVFSQSTSAREGKGLDYALTLIKFESGAVANVESTWMDPSGFRTSFEVAGSAGLISHDTRENSSLRLVPKEGKERFEQNRLPSEDPYFSELSAFVHSVEALATPPVTLAEGYDALAISMAAIESAQTGVPVRPALRSFAAVPSQ